MKLVELLAKELEEWADTTLYYTQDSNGGVFPWVAKPHLFEGFWESEPLQGWSNIDQNTEAFSYNLDLASDWDEAIVTKEMWLAEKGNLGRLDVLDVAPFEVGSIGNYYGGLLIKRENGTPYWGIENYDGTYWEEISEELYNLLKELRRGEE